MSALLTPTHRRTAPESTPFRWTVRDLLELNEPNPFSEKRIELLDGEIYEMAIPGPLHDFCVFTLLAALQALFGPRYHVRVQSGFPTAPDTNPMPDLAVVAGRARDYLRYPTPDEAALIVEVADSSARLDLGKKAHLYAAAGIREYWVVDLAGRCLHVHRDPRPDEYTPNGHRYFSIAVLKETESVTALGAAEGSLAIHDFLPFGETP